MSAESALERELRAAFSMSLGQADGHFTEWGTSPRSRRELELAAHPLRWRFARTRRSWIKTAVLAACVVFLVAATAAWLVPAVMPRSSCAGCEGTAVWAVAAQDATHLVAVGGTDDDRGRLVLLRSSDGGGTWSTTHPDAPALVSIAKAGSRLYGSTACVGPASAGATDTQRLPPLPTTCLYASDDGGSTWHDAGAGPLVDPSFADPSNGWAHTPGLETEAASTFYSTSDGGRSWQVEASPCAAETPYIFKAVATAPGAGYALCVGPGYGTASREWEIVHVIPGSAPEVVSGRNTTAFEPGWVTAFFMRPDGTGLLISDQVYRTVDGGRTWTPTGQDEVWTAITGVSFVSPAVGYAAFRSTGDVSGVDITTDGGLTWRPAAAWDWWSFDRVYLSTPSTRP